MSSLVSSVWVTLSPVDVSSAAYVMEMRLAEVLVEPFLACLSPNRVSDEPKLRSSVLRVRVRLRGRSKSSTESFSEEIRLVLSMLINMQIVIEKIAGQHGGLKRRRQAITCVEALKVLARLVLVATTREMLIDGGQVGPSWQSSLVFGGWTGFATAVDND